ncbi:MAG: NADH dehydrogenase subunit [Bdellovibrionaceae bacterium]|nr:NADH dehydrogenase subunit [Pseudobdellovibrionaceae bacterium]
MLKCKINGQDVEVAEGSSIIEAFKATGQDIAHYCWHPGLSVAGVCRLCMVEIEGNPRLQIACNTQVQEGMVINNNSDKIKDAVKWGLDFHLINHPLDCPICAQAGECQLQIQYMKFGQYDPEMAERKVKKRKVVDLGPKIVLDTERCILCSRCVRFTDEVSKTNELGIFNRGDHSEIGTVDDRPLDNPYSVNTVDICPVGALTSREFRFQQRVWYLKNETTVCNGCSTGCSTKVYFNEEGMWRVKPDHNDDVNGYWMCDEGRGTPRFVNKDSRLLSAWNGQKDEGQDLEAGAAAKAVGQTLKKVVAEQGSDKVAFVVTGQYTDQENRAFLSLAKDLGVKVYHWVNNPEKMDEFDGLLIRGDKNPNTYGLKEAMKEVGVGSPWSELESSVSDLEYVVVAGPENHFAYSDLTDKVDLFSKANHQVWFVAGDHDVLRAASNKVSLIPTKTYVEKDGTYKNFEGREQRIRRVMTLVPGALSLTEASKLMSGQELLVDGNVSESYRKTNFFSSNERGYL